MSKSDLWVVIPVKPFSLAKSRLSPMLDDATRTALCSTMLSDVIAAIKEAKEVIKWGIVSRDEQVLASAERFGGRTFNEKGTDLNSSLNFVAEQLLHEGGTGILVIPMDVPLITGEDIDILIRKAAGERSIAIAPCRESTGTNAILVAPPTTIKFSFGDNSFQKHKELAIEAEMVTNICNLDNIALDVDTPEDLLALVERKWERYLAFIPDGFNTHPFVRRRVGVGDSRY